ncbi:MAG: DUF2934 domain-containing protein [Gammaproteobacteria bacterium]|jgi:hypothetical protein
MKTRSRARRPEEAPFSGGPISSDDRRRMIAEAAYFRAEHRGFEGGDPDEDWYQAEREIDRLLARYAPAERMQHPH